MNSSVMSPPHNHVEDVGSGSGSEVSSGCFVWLVKIVLNPQREIQKKPLMPEYFALLIYTYIFFISSPDNL
jgi:hypothetical protein